MLNYFCGDWTAGGNQRFFSLTYTNSYCLFYIFFVSFSIAMRWGERIPYILLQNWVKWLVNNLDRDFKALPRLPNEE